MIKNKWMMVLLVILMALVWMPKEVNATSKVNVYIFYGDGCPHCAALEEDIKPIQKKYPYIVVKKYEVWYSTANRLIMTKVAKSMGETVSGVPFVVIGEKSFSGYSEDLGPALIEKYVKYYKDVASYNDPVAKVLDSIEKTTPSKETKKETTDEEDKLLTVPFFGKVNLSHLSVPLAAIVIGTVDGFNPCAMWVLLFLISFLMHLSDRRKMWTFGLTFLFVEGLVYMGFMTLVFQFIDLMGYVPVIKMLIAAIALIGGFINLRSYIRYDETGCEIVDETKRKTIMKKIKKVTSEKNFWLALLGVALLAASVNVVELACSAGLPTVFLSILSANKVGGISSFLSILIYIIFYMIDDIFIFVIAMTSLKLTGLSGKYGKYSHLIGGIIMLVIGVLMLFKPEWLMFNF